MDERPWQFSEGAAHSPLYKEVLDEVKPLVQNSNGYIIDEPENRIFTDYDFDEEGYAPEYFKRLLKSRFFQDLPSDLKAEAVKAFTHAEGEWKYAPVWDSEPALIDGKLPTATQPTRPSDALILSGLAGSELIGGRRKLDNLMPQLEENPLRRAILLGGIGLIAAQGVWGHRSRNEMSLYTRKVNELFSETTGVGGTFHGDFAVMRRRAFNGPVVDPMGRELPFAPSLPETTLGAYHSTEPEILASVIKHAALTGVDLSVLRSSVMEKLGANGAQTVTAGPFADYGYDDGRLPANMLEHWLEQPRPTANEVVLTRLVVWPGDRTAFTATSKPDGLHFSHVSESGSQKEEIVLQNDELEYFVLALFEQSQRGLGRTGPHALLSVLDVLKT